MSPRSSHRFLVPAAVSGLIVILACQLWFSIRHESQTFDESAHMYSGMEYWKRADFGVNPEHPPLVKLLASLPLLGLHLQLPPPPDRFFRIASALGGIQYLYASGNNVDSLLFRARVAASLLTLLLALMIFFAGREMFGTGAGLLALVIFVFEPNLLANGALVTTDMGAACGMFTAVYAFYRYAKKRTLFRLLICAVVTGLALATKHSSLLIWPLLGVLVIAELVRRHSDAEDPATQVPLTRRMAGWAGALVVIGVIAVTVLWAFYGFHYRARPGNASINPPLAAYLPTLRHPWEERATLALSGSHLLPEAYVYGLADIEIVTQQGRAAYLLGKLYPTGQWFYFPAAFLIKCTLGFLLLLALLIFARNLRAREKRRELLFLALPALVYFAISLTSHLDIGLRHILPVFPFFVVLAGAGAWGLIHQSRRWAYVIVVLLVSHAASSLRAFPYYLSYSNEICGGPSKTYKVLSDANVGWTSGLKALQGYITAHHITDCWFAYSGAAPYAYYQIPCRPLPTYLSAYNGSERGTVPTSIDGPVFINEIEHAGFWWGPGSLNPYQQFANRTPDDVVAGETLVFNGHFEVLAISALSHLHAGTVMVQSGKAEQALPEVQASLALNPDSVYAHAILGLVLAQLNRNDEAHAEFQKARALARSQYPEFQKGTLPQIDSLEH